MWKSTALFVLLCTFSSADAQWDFGAYLGMARVQLKGDTPENFTYRAGYHPNFGAIINYYFKDDARISFQPGYAINKPTLAWKDRELDEKRDSIRLNLGTLRFPVYLDIISDNGKWHYVGGIDFQVALNQKGSAIGSDETFDFNDELTNFNPLVVFGIGRRIPIGSSKLSVDLRFGQSILNISNEPDDQTSLVPRIKTSSFELLLTYEFTKKERSGS
jgi:hypothetical protein